MFSKSNGWAVITLLRGTSTRPGTVYTGRLGFVLHTRDGGHTWSNVSPALPGLGGGEGCDCTDNMMAGFFFLDDSHGWVAANDTRIPGNQVYNGISVWRTGYSGHSWQSGGGGLNGPYMIGLSFIDPLHGWLLLGERLPFDGPGQPAMLFQTGDGGDSWQMIADDGITIQNDRWGTPTAPMSKPDRGVTPFIHTGMLFESVNSGWMTVYQFEDSPDEHGLLLHSVDGGKTWNPVTADAKQYPAGVMKICRNDNLSYYAPGRLAFMAQCYNNDTNTASTLWYHSTDDGKSWHSTPIPDVLTNPRVWPVLYSINANVAFALGCDIPGVAESPACPSNPSGALSLYKTIDAGKTWVAIGPLPDTIGLAIPSDGGSFNGPSFDFIDEQNGWAIDPAGGLETTTDGGKTWAALSTKIGVTSGAATGIASPTPGAECLAAFPARLKTGAKAHITPGASNNLRKTASRNGHLVGTIPGGAEVQVLAGPVCDGSLFCWQIRYQGMTGWTPETDGSTYFITPG